MGVSEHPVMGYAPPCPSSLKGILYQSLQTPSVLPLPPPSLGPGGLDSPWVDPSQVPAWPLPSPGLTTPRLPASTAESSSPGTPFASLPLRLLLAPCCHFIWSRQLCQASHLSPSGPTLLTSGPALSTQSVLKVMSTRGQRYIAYPPPPLL